MKGVHRAKWIANFDMEPLISSILRTGMILSVILIFAGMITSWFLKENDFGPNLHAKSIPELLWIDLQQFHYPEMVPRLLIHLAVSVLLLTPYVRVLVSMLYFAFIENNWKYVAFSGLVLIILTVALLSNIV